HGNQGKHRVTKRGPALSYPMFTLVTSEDIAGSHRSLPNLIYRNTISTSAVIITAFDLGDIQTLEHTKRWLQDALRENEPDTCSVFLVGTKKDTLSEAECERTERDALKFAVEMQAEYWSVSAKTALAFELSMKKELEKNRLSTAQIGDGNLIRW
ncbi:unnamed protein product, partial [Ranitomeya imitator]